MNGVLTRDLYKAFGILFVFSVHGEAGKFNVVPLFVKLGSGLALLGLVRSQNPRIIGDGLPTLNAPVYPDATILHNLPTLHVTVLCRLQWDC